MIENTMKVMSALPEMQAKEVADFADFMLKKYEESALLEGIQNAIADSSSFSFLDDEDDIYSMADVKGPYNA